MKTECEALFWGTLLIARPSLLLCFFAFFVFFLPQTLEDCMSTRMEIEKKKNVIIIFICKYAKM